MVWFALRKYYFTQYFIGAVDTDIQLYLVLDANTSYHQPSDLIPAMQCVGMGQAWKVHHLSIS